MIFHNTSFAALVVASLTALSASSAYASTKENAENYIAQRLVQEYTGKLDEQVDSRFGEVLASVAGCQLGDFFKREGMAAALKLLKSEATQRIRLNGRADAVAERAAHKALEIAKAQADKRLADALAKHCDRAEWAKKLGQHNVDVAEDMLVILEPQIKANRDALIRGDFEALLATLVGEGTRLGFVIKNLGEVDLETQERKELSAWLATLTEGQLQDLASIYEGRYEQYCEPNSMFTARKIVERVRNEASNILEMPNSPIETMIEKLVEKVIGGDNPMLNSDQIAITKHDVKTHDHTQHEQQNSDCFDVEARWELVNRELRGIALGKVTRAVTPDELRSTNQAKKGLLWAVEPSRANASKRDRSIRRR